MSALQDLTVAETDYLQTLLMKRLIALNDSEQTPAYKTAHRTIKDRMRNERKLIMNIASRLQ